MLKMFQRNSLRQKHCPHVNLLKFRNLRRKGCRTRLIYTTALMATSKSRPWLKSDEKLTEKISVKTAGSRPMNMIPSTVGSTSLLAIRFLKSPAARADLLFISQRNSSVELQGLISTRRSENCESTSTGCQNTGCQI